MKQVVDIKIYGELADAFEAIKVETDYEYNDQMALSDQPLTDGLACAAYNQGIADFLMKLRMYAASNVPMLITEKSDIHQDPTEP